ncbi:MAG: class I SAM-dependent methyltransferase [Candidatus Acidiferrales bacterium]
MNAQQPEQTRLAWDRIAQGYDKFVTGKHMSLANEALRRAGLRNGMRFLDVACGTGALSLPAARHGALVTATDLSPAMVDLVKARARSEGHITLEARTMDGHNLELPDNTFDVSGSQFGVMLFPDLPRGLRELVRVTKPGGRVVIVAFGPVQEVEFLGFFMRAIKSVVPSFAGLPMDPPPLPFQVGNPEKLRQEMVSAGLKDVRVERLTQELNFQDGKAFSEWLMNSNPIPAMLVAGFTAEQKAAIEKALDSLVKERAGSTGAAQLSHPINIGIGTK